MTNISPEIVARMEALVRAMVVNDSEDRHVKHRGYYADYLEAHKIVALLPEPVDPDLIEAREVMALEYEKKGTEHLARAARDGTGDIWFQSRIAIAAIKRGRELAAKDKA